MSMSIMLRQQKRQVTPSVNKSEILFDQLKSSDTSFNLCLPLIIKRGSMSIERIRSTTREICRQIIDDVNRENLFPIQVIYTHQNLENITNFLTKIDNNHVVRFYLIKRSKINGEYLYSDDLIIIVFQRITSNSISLEAFLKIFLQIYDKNNDRFTVDLSRNLYKPILDGYDSTNHSSFISNLRYSIDFILDSTIVNNQIDFTLSNDFTLFQVNLAAFFLFVYKFEENSIDDLCILCSTDQFTRVHPFRIQMRSNESFVDFAQRIQQLSTDMIEYDRILSIYDGFSSLNIPFYFQYNSSSRLPTKIDLTTNEVSLDVYPDESLLTKKYDIRSNLSLIMTYDDNLRTFNCTFEGSDDIIELSQKFQRSLSYLFSKSTVNQEPIEKLRLPSLDEPAVQRRLSIFDAGLFVCLD